MGVVKLDERDSYAFRVIHPLYDEPEEKCSTEGLPPIKLPKIGRISLTILRIYLILMFLLLLYRGITMAGSFTQIAGH